MPAAGDGPGLGCEVRSGQVSPMTATYRCEGGSGGRNAACLDFLLGQLRQLLGLDSLVAGSGLQGQVGDDQETGLLRSGPETRQFRTHTTLALVF